ncbi:ABC-2 type transport system permease protein [Clostridium sp. DSM 8431]|uniref:ABC transporter permease n=1 Tax=Clostridium sp. DSM 8431 TaxID=1761781 RepID=UPI0008E0A2C8|nr:ABC transporter permease [Clostridium sp. DSM 8431]SFU62273.1 ABC-2 type transport system permease protein [Clostridium sp. DSM 8431]
MKQFFTVLNFELSNYFKNKSYLLTTILISIFLIVGLSIPRFFDAGKLFNSSNDDKENTIVVYDKNNILENVDILEPYFLDAKITSADSESNAENMINDKDADAGFIINSFDDYTYLVYNNGFNDDNQKIYEQAISRIFRDSYLTSKGINAEEIESLFNMPINSDIQVLGKDSVSNYAYTYGLIFIIYIVVLTYGQLIATSVTSEKSNRAIEVLVTSASTNSLIFGKVIAGAIASLIQVGIIISSGLISYKFNSDAWDNKLDMVFDIPSEVLLCFAVFGVLGFLFYSFIFGTLGALVSKTEDISKSVMPITMIFVVIFMLVMINLTNTDGTVVKILSYIPFSSLIAMFTRSAMGTVATVEILISLAILIASTIVTGLLASKIYRRATLMYGNPIKLTKALKWIKKED